VNTVDELLESFIAGQDIINTAIDQWSVSMQVVDILNTFCEQTLANNFYFYVFFWIKLHLPMVSDFNCVDA